MITYMMLYKLSLVRKKGMIEIHISFLLLDEMSALSVNMSF